MKFSANEASSQLSSAATISSTHASEAIRTTGRLDEGRVGVVILGLMKVAVLRLAR